MAATETVLKPDFGAKRKHFIFTDEHEQLRESIRGFVTREFAPHSEEWEETTFPDWVFEKLGKQGFLGLAQPVDYGGGGGAYYPPPVLGGRRGPPDTRGRGQAPRRPPD